MVLGVVGYPPYLAVVLHQVCEGQCANPDDVVRAQAILVPHLNVPYPTASLARDHCTQSAVACCVQALSGWCVERCVNGCVSGVEGRRVAERCVLGVLVVGGGGEVHAQT
jgi:hypothetical protein